MGRIQTGVDKLVALVKEKQKVSVDDAAKALGVSKTIIQEWSDFLEEEGLIEVKYSFAKTYLVEHQLNKAETAQKERQFEQQRETFIGKVDQSIQAVDHEAKGFEEFKKEFQTLKKDLAQSLEHLDTELNALHQLERTKQHTAVNLTKQRELLKRQEHAAEQAMAHEYRRYHDLLHAVTIEEKTLSDHKRRVNTILRGESSSSSKILNYTASIAQLRARVARETAAMNAGAKGLRGLERGAHVIKRKLAAIERSKLRPLEREHEAIERKTKELEQRIIAKAKADRAHAKHPDGMKVRARRSIEELFRRKKAIEHLLAAMEHDKHELLGELDELEARAEAFHSEKNAAKLEELRKKLKVMEASRNQLKAHLGQFTNLL